MTVCLTDSLYSSALDVTNFSGLKFVYLATSKPTLLLTDDNFVLFSSDKHNTLQYK